MNAAATLLPKKTVPSGSDSRYVAQAGMLWASGAAITAKVSVCGSNSRNVVGAMEELYVPGALAVTSTLPLAMSTAAPFSQARPFGKIGPIDHVPAAAPPLG